MSSNPAWSVRRVALFALDRSLAAAFFPIPRSRVLARQLGESSLLAHVNNNISFRRSLQLIETCAASATQMQLFDSARRRVLESNLNLKSFKAHCVHLLSPPIAF
jgi:hypothetical protein